MRSRVCAAECLAVALALSTLLLQNVAAESKAETMTLCMNCTHATEGGVAASCTSADDDPEVFHPPLDTCFNPRKLWPASKSEAWGASDVLDQCNAGVSVLRTFYDSTDGSCSGIRDTYTLPLGVCLGPFGAPRPWGVFECGGADAGLRSGSGLRAVDDAETDLDVVLA
eukprot:TRINITY_DN81349_c0_g1_i1.p2 TRINITY_DN81349_c0_g1~~TRINITY_DN81349_c0_g1_i1.p2  ORF type:complete len:169 (-),score=16.60 TRINITY_DN81349_c0_g1_i1:296-802(-)